MEGQPHSRLTTVGDAASPSRSSDHPAAVSASTAAPTAGYPNRAAQICRPQILGCLDPVSLLRCSGVSRRLRRAVTLSDHLLRRAAGRMGVAVIAAGSEIAFLRSPLSVHPGQLRVVRRVLADGCVSLSLHLPAVGFFEQRPRDWPQQLRALLSAAESAAGDGPLRELRLVNGFAALVSECAEADRDRLVALLAAGGCSRLRFDSTQAQSGHWPPLSAERDQHAAFLVQLTALPQLTDLSVPQLTLPHSDPEAGLLMVLQQLRSLRLGVGVPQSDANLTAVAALPQLTALEWAGWSAATLRKLSAAPPPCLSALALRDEPRLTLTATSPLAALPQLERLSLCRLPELLGRFAHAAIANLGRCTNLTALELQMDNADAVLGERSKLNQLCTALLQLPLRLLELSGAAVGADLMHALLEAQQQVALRSPPLPLEGLTLHGLRLGEVDWTLLVQQRLTAAAPNAAFGFDPAATDSAVEREWQAHFDPVGLQLAPMRGLSQLTLVDCSQHGCLLPYLRLLPRLSDLRLLASALLDPLVTTPPRKVAHRPPAEQTVGLPDPFAVDPPSATQPDALSPLILAPIRTLDFLSLADCARLRSFRCHYPIAPLLSEGDANLFGLAAVAELERRRPGLRVQLK